nr:tRNA (adenosine(37)-N6)-dimethylallyltransferase MiaA [uncultured Anaerostipes sp.]
MKPMVILTGPTAVGKTALSIRLAKAIGGEIISADSMQVYQKMNIGTAKIKTDEMEGIPHYLVDVLDPAEEFHVARFQKMAKEALQNIYGKGKIPLVVGGTGFYIQSLLYDIDFEEEEQDMEYREMLWKMSREKGNEALHRMLSQKDPVSAQKIHPNNVKRVIRALEFYRLNGYPISEHNEKESQKESPYQFAYFVLNQDRKKLYERIDQRVDLMMEAGLLKEVQELKEEGYGKSLVSMQGIGYKEIYEYLEGNLTLDQAVDLIKKDTRHFAKRQLTWFGREKDVIMIQKEQFETEEEILQHMLEILKQKGIYHG